MSSNIPQVPKVPDAENITAAKSFVDSFPENPRPKNLSKNLDQQAKEAKQNPKPRSKIKAASKEKIKQEAKKQSKSTQARENSKQADILNDFPVDFLPPYMKIQDPAKQKSAFIYFFGSSYSFRDFRDNHKNIKLYLKKI